MAESDHRVRDDRPVDVDAGGDLANEVAGLLSLIDEIRASHDSPDLGDPEGVAGAASGVGVSANVSHRSCGQTIVATS